MGTQKHKNTKTQKHTTHNTKHKNTKTHKHINTQRQIHKYTNTKYTNTVTVKVANRPSMCYIFEKAMVQGPQKQCSQVSDVQTHKDKYTNTQIQNTQIQLRSKLQIGPICAIFLKRQWYKELNNSVPKCLTCKHTKTNTQIHKYKIHKYNYGQSCR